MWTLGHPNVEQQACAWAEHFHASMNLQTNWFQTRPWEGPFDICWEAIEWNSLCGQWLPCCRKDGLGMFGVCSTCINLYCQGILDFLGCYRNLRLWGFGFGHVSTDFCNSCWGHGWGTGAAWSISAWDVERSFAPLWNGSPSSLTWRVGWWSERHNVDSRILH